MNQIAQYIHKFFTSRSAHCDIRDENVLDFSYKGKNKSEICVTIIFSENGRRVAFRCFDIAELKDKSVLSEATAFHLCNRINRDNFWIKFFISEDNKYTAAADAIVDTYTVGDECYELANRMAIMVDKYYPVIMHSIWSSPNLFQTDDTE